MLIIQNPISEHRNISKRGSIPFIENIKIISNKIMQANKIYHLNLKTLIFQLVSSFIKMCSKIFLCQSQQR